jgi:hypothetical protein
VFTAPNGGPLDPDDFRSRTWIPAAAGAGSDPLRCLSKHRCGGRPDVWLDIKCVRASARDLVQFDPDDCIGTIGVITQHVILDLVVVRESEFAVGALVGWFVHAWILADSRGRQTGSNDTLSWDR